MSNIDRKHACAFTGHRPERLDAPEEEVKKWLEEQILQAIQDGYTYFITGMQRGVDLWAAEILLKLKNEGREIQIIAACAFEGMEKGWGEEWKKIYFETREAASEVHAISGYRSKWAFIKRNEWMVDHANRLIAVFTGTAGGTKKTVEYAIKNRLEIKRFPLR